MNRKKALLVAIRVFVSESERGVRLLQEKFGDGNVLLARRRGLIPPEGDLPGDVSYSFHGIGCCLESAAGFIDFEFSPGGNAGAFDTWRLKMFMSSNLAEYSELLAVLDEELEKLKAAGLVIMPVEWGDRRSYYLATPVGF